MARIVLNKQVGMHVIYQLDAGVGRNRANNRSDVALVQFFLEQSRYKWGGAKTVTMDGSCGPTTLEAIAQFQAYINALFKAPFLSTDGAIDPLRSSPSASSQSTLVQLQILFSQALPGQFPFFHKMNSFKAELVPELFKL